jgi:hypothetical protein
MSDVRQTRMRRTSEAPHRRPPDGMPFATPPGGALADGHSDCWSATPSNSQDVAICSVEWPSVGRQPSWMYFWTYEWTDASNGRILDAIFPKDVQSDNPT